MHKDFYASGFLYYPPTQQILLQQRPTTHSPSAWFLLGGKNLIEETSEVAFQRIVNRIIQVKLTLSAIHPVYMYFHEGMGKHHCILYAEVKKMGKQTDTKEKKFGWFTRKQILKLDLDEQTRQDITVGQRVIDAEQRRRLGQRTLQ